MQQLLDTTNDSKGIPQKGELVEGCFLFANDRDLYFDIGEKQDGQCPREEFKQLPTPGERIQLMVLRENQDGMSRLSFKEARNWISWQDICEAHRVEASLSGDICKVFDHGYLVNYGSLQFYMPFSQSGVRPNFQKRLAIGSEISFQVLELKKSHRSAIVSHRKVVERFNQEKWNKFLSQYKEGDTIEGKVLKKVSFGLFIDVEGIEGLLHSNDISWRRNTSFKNRFRLNEPIRAKILKIDSNNNRLNLGLKQLSEDPWLWAARELSTGQTLEGEVTALCDYGAFVEIVEGLEGLLHISEITWSQRPGHPKKYLQLGQKLSLQLLGLDFEKKRLALSLKHLQGDPWEKVGREINEGDIFEGEVGTVNRFGAFVEICSGLEGLIRFSDYSWKEPVNKKMLSPKQKIRFMIIEINITEKRIRCGIKQLDESPYQKLFQSPGKGSVVEGTVIRVMSFGVFVRVDEGVDGLIPRSEALANSEDGLERAYKVGEKIQVVLMDINVDRQKVILSSKALRFKEEQEVAGRYIKKEDTPSTSSPFAALLKKEMPTSNPDNNSSSASSSATDNVKNS